MSAQQPRPARSSQTASEVVQPMAVSLAGAGAAPSLSLVGAEAPAGTGGYRLSGLLPGRPYCLSSPDERDETVRQVRAYFGHVDFWEPV
jgi:hypothetical protein